MSKRLQNKVAVVTGGTSGIGLAVAKLFAAEGAKVFVIGRRQPELTAAEKTIGNGSVGIQGDVSKPEDIDRVYASIKEKAGRIDVLFANAGMAHVATIEEIDEAQYHETFGTNVAGVLFAVQKALPLMHAGSNIVVNASMWTIKGVPGFGLLSASKAAVRSLVRTWTSELKDRQIRVNAVSPGYCNTAAIEHATGSYEGAQELLAKFALNVPMGRVSQPDEIAKAVLFLASDDASYVNGAELFVDGGTVQV